MATNFPTSLDSLTNPTTGNPLSSPSHAGQHADANDAIEALEAKVGANGSAVTTSHDYKIAALEANNSVTNARLRDSVATSVIGRSANSTGDPADIAAASDGQVLRRASGTLAFGTIATAGIGDLQVTTGKIANNAVTNDKLRDSGGQSVIGNPTGSVAGPIDISVAADRVLGRSGSGNLSGVQIVTNMITDSNVTTGKIANNAVNNTKIRDSAGLSVIGRSANTTGDPADITAGTDGHVLRRSGTSLGFGQIATAGIADGAVTAAKLSPAITHASNIVYNGAMQVAQRGTSTTGITGGGYYTADRWRTTNPSTGTWTNTVENDAPTGSGFRKSFKTLCTTAVPAPTAAQLLRIDQYFEGQDLQRIKKGTSAAEQLTVSFWVKSNVTGTYIVELQDNDNSRHVSKSYTISSSGTWEFKTLTFPADTTGQFDNDNVLSLEFRFWLVAGSDFKSGTLATSWASSTNANRAVGQTNLAAATSNYWQITGVQLETGPVATPFEHLPFGVELAKCQRYYCSIDLGANSYLVALTYTGGATITSRHTFPVTMRTDPTVSFGAAGASRYVSNAGIFNGLTFTAGSTRDAARISGNALGVASFGWIDLTAFNASAEF